MSLAPNRSSSYSSFDDAAEHGQRDQQRDAVLGQHLLRSDLDSLQTQVEALDLDLAACRPDTRAEKGRQSAGPCVFRQRPLGASAFSARAG